MSGRALVRQTPAVPGGTDASKVGAMAELIGERAAIVGVCTQVNRLLQQAGRRPLPILLRDETGTGKRLVAHAIHVAGPRAAGPFTDVSCAAISDTLLESEM